MDDKNGIGWAVDMMRRSKRVARAGWNGKGMWLFLVPGGFGLPDHAGKDREVLAYVMMKTADDKLVPWLCSQADLLATDWQEVA